MDNSDSDTLGCIGCIGCLWLLWIIGGDTALIIILILVFLA
jgi:hypothetical protein